MAQKDLIPFSKRSKEEAKKQGSKGGKKSGEVRKEKKLLKEQLEILLAMKDEDGVSNSDKMIKALYDKSMIGDTKAFELIRDTIGQKPKDEQEIKITYEDRLKEAEDEEEY